MYIQKIKLLYLHLKLLEYNGFNKDCLILYLKRTNVWAKKPIPSNYANSSYWWLLDMLKIYS